MNRRHQSTLLEFAQRRVGSHRLSLVSVNKKIASWESIKTCSRLQSWSTLSSSWLGTGCPGIGIPITTPSASWKTNRDGLLMLSRRLSEKLSIEQKCPTMYIKLANNLPHMQHPLPRADPKIQLNRAAEWKQRIRMQKVTHAKRETRTQTPLKNQLSYHVKPSIVQQA